MGGTESERIPPAPDAGFLLADKPAGVTSHTVVAAARREHGMRAGHAGTLDPFATGLLVILLGRATRLQRYILGLPKTYMATARLGWTSTTGDPEGELTHTGNLPEKLELPTGVITQTVPLTSAVRVDGERLYKKAHRGEEAELPRREVEIYRAELLEHEAGSDRASFEIECAAGTYIRTLVEELGDAYCEGLRRTRVGHLALNDRNGVLPVEELLAHLPTRELTGPEAEDVVCGRVVDSAASELEGEPLGLMLGERLLAVARPRGGSLKTDVVLA